MRSRESFIYMMCGRTAPVPTARPARQIDRRTALARQGIYLTKRAVADSDRLCREVNRG